jgi:hypothetical protein
MPSQLVSSPNRFAVQGEVHMQRRTLYIFMATTVASISTAVPASAQETIRIRGTIKSNEWPYEIHNGRSQTRHVRWFNGNDASRRNSKGDRGAHISRIDAGTGEGHYDWDLKPKSKMTNANVEQTVAGVDGEILPSSTRMEKRRSS